MKEILKDSEAKMKKTVELLAGEFARIRTSRANPALLEGIKVNYYGVPTPLKQIASIGVPDPRSLVIQPWDKNALGAIEKAIQASDLGLNPNVEANLIQRLRGSGSSRKKRRTAKSARMICTAVRNRCRSLPIATSRSWTSSSPRRRRRSSNSKK